MKLHERMRSMAQSYADKVVGRCVCGDPDCQRRSMYDELVTTFVVAWSAACVSLSATPDTEVAPDTREGSIEESVVMMEWAAVLRCRKEAVQC